ncbi:MAG TPA: hypothetical protein VFV95_12730 [Vicinamibacterales bacterium]|nr:hypothetical protein [Vicinamibacterales bacterium]
MSPILVRPVREQLEHDRVIRLLQAKYKRKYEVAINPGNEQTMPVGNGPSAWYPDLVLQNTDRGHKLAGVVEVETAESVNNLEAMSQWASFARLRVPFHLYLPTASVDSARRFCADLSIPVAEMWAYQSIGDQLRFTLVHRTPQPGDSKESKEPRDGRDARDVKAKVASSENSRPVAAAPKKAATVRRAASGGSAKPARRPVSATPARRRPAPAKKAAVQRRTAKPVARGKAKAAPRAGRAQKRR